MFTAATVSKTMTSINASTLLRTRTTAAAAPVMMARHVVSFSTTKPRLSDAAAVGMRQATTKPPGLIKRLASTPRGRVTLAGAFLAGCVLDYELYTLYGAPYLHGNSSSSSTTTTSSSN